NPVNVRYLTGFQSTNAALLVEPDAVKLFTDFRYLDAARALEDVEVVQTRRNMHADLAELLPERIAFEADHLTFSRVDELRSGGRDGVPTQNAVEQLREIKDEDELAAVRRAGELTNEMFSGLAELAFVGETERSLAGWIQARFLELGAESVGFAHVAAGANG